MVDAIPAVFAPAPQTNDCQVVTLPARHIEVYEFQLLFGAVLLTYEYFLEALSGGINAAGRVALVIGLYGTGDFGLAPLSFPGSNMVSLKDLVG